MRISLLAYRTLQSVRNAGVAETCRRIVRYLCPKPNENSFDTIHKTDTGGVLKLWELNTDSANLWFGKSYQAIPENELEAGLAFLQDNWTTFNFVDLGCGKGRALIIASRLGFSRVIGVEFVESLVNIARENIRITKANAEVVFEDAARFEYPDGNLVLLMYNPFGEEVMRPVIRNLRKHRGEKLYVLYEQPEQMAVIDAEADFLVKVGKIPNSLQLFAWKRRT